MELRISVICDTVPYVVKGKEVCIGLADFKFLFIFRDGVKYYTIFRDGVKYYTIHL